MLWWTFGVYLDIIWWIHQKIGEIILLVLSKTEQGYSFCSQKGIIQFMHFEFRGLEAGVRPEFKDSRIRWITIK